MTKLKNSICDGSTLVIMTVVKVTVVTVVIVTEVTVVIVTVVILTVVIFTSISKNNSTPQAQHPCDVFRAAFRNLVMFGSQRSLLKKKIGLF